MLLFRLVTLLLTLWPCRSETLLCATCECETSVEKESSQNVICERKGLTIVPAGSTWPPNIYELDLSHNFIEHLTHLEPSNVTVLNFHQNSIVFTGPGVFSVFPQLQVLDLSQNKLTSLHMDAFTGLSNLRVLNVSHNRIRTLPSELFLPLVSLEQLSVSHNPLRYAEKTWFTSLHKLELLDMSTVDAHSLPDGIFHNLPALVHVDLSGNSFDEVPSSALRSAEALKVLVVSDNPISVLSYNSFYKLHNIETLYIQNMPELTVVEGDTFVYLRKLRELYLDNNPKLADIDLDAFGIFWRVESAANWTLKELYLGNNDIIWLDVEVAPWDEFSILDLQGNPFACHCSNAWIRKIPLQPELTVQLWCEGLNGRERFLEAPDELFACVDESSKQRSSLRTAVVVVGSISVAAILLSAILLVKRKALHQRFLGRKGRNGSVYYVKAHTNPVDDQNA